jgi:hypothetical protein
MLIIQLFTTTINIIIKGYLKKLIEYDSILFTKPYYTKL